MVATEEHKVASLTIDGNVGTLIVKGTVGQLTIIGEVRNLSVGQAPEATVESSLTRGTALRAVTEALVADRERLLHRIPEA